MKDKKQKYLSLIERARQNYEYKKHANFKWCDECKKAINLWTYWQGLGYEIDTQKNKNRACGARLGQYRF